MKRYCQTLELVDDLELIERYCDIHAHVWPEVVAGQREVGILDMQLYRYETHVFMICDTVSTGIAIWHGCPNCLVRPNGKPM